MRTSGWIVFAGIMLFMAGVFGAIDGLVAIVHEQVWVVAEDEVILLDVTAWGWVHLIVGAIAIASGLAVLSGQVWAMILGVLLAMTSAFTQLLFITVFPWWSLAIIAIDVLVIYGLVVHGEESVQAGGYASAQRQSGVGS
jgi:hypothetical protein